MKERFDKSNASEFGCDIIQFILHDELTGEYGVVRLSDIRAFDDALFIVWRDGMPDAWKGDIVIATPDYSNMYEALPMKYNGRFWIERLKERM